MTGIDLRKIREAQNLSQKQVASMMGIHRETLMNLEKLEVDIPLEKELLFLSVMGMESGRKIQHTEDEGSMYGTHQLALDKVQRSNLEIVTSATSSASLELLCEVLSAVTNEPLESVKERARELTVIKTRSVEKFLKTII